MPLTILPFRPERVSSGVELLQNLGTGLGQGLTKLAQEKMNKIRQQQFAQSLHKIGYSPEQSDVLAYLQQNSPEHFHQIIGQTNTPSIQSQSGQQQQPLFSRPKSEAQDLKIEARKDKLRPELTYLNDLETTAQELRNLIKDQKDPVSFGVKSAALSNIPVIGSQFLSGNTGAFDALSNKFHTDATQGSKNVRSVYHVKILGASKPSLNKTKEQNEKLLNHWQKVIDKKRADFLKAHPEFSSEVESNNQPQAQLQHSAQQQVAQQMQQSEQPRFRKNAKGQVQEWDSVSQSYKDL